MFKEKPLAGWGAAYTYVLGTFFGKERMAAHNTALQLLVSFGLIGTLFAFVAILATVWRLWRQRGDPWARTLIAVMGSTGVFAIVSSLAYEKHFWVLLALAANADVLRHQHDLPSGVRVRTRRAVPIKTAGR